MVRFLCAALVATVCASVAGANAGPPWVGGRVVADPVGMKGVRVLHETLVIDLRPVARGEFAYVEATYHFRSDGPARPLELWFATGANEIDGFAVTFDGSPVPVRAIDAPLPASWMPPKQTPGLGEPALTYWPSLNDNSVKTVGFVLPVAPGEHTLNVKYRAPASKNLHGYPVAYQQFAYVLAPVKHWEAFGKLDVTVHVPEGWAAASEPALARAGDTLSGTFEGVPADALALTLRAPIGRAYGITQVVLWVVFALACTATVWALWRIGRALGRRRNPWAIVALGTALAIGAGALVTVGLLLAVYGPETTIPTQLLGGSSTTYLAFAIALVAPAVAVPAFAALAVGTGLVVRHLNRPAPPAS